MRIEKLGTKNLIGYSITTSNEDEKSPASAKIPGLWGTFFNEIHMRELRGETVYGVYSDYESGQDGRYRLTAAVEKGDNASTRGAIKELRLEAGRYVIFSGMRGEGNPVLDLWKEVWAHFGKTGGKDQRLFSTDFEVFHPDGKIELCISIRE